MLKQEYRSSLTAAFHDIPFITFFCILVIKLIFFTYFSYKETVPFALFILTFLPSFGALLVLLSISLFLKNGILKLTYLFLLDLIFSFLFITHSLYYRYFEDFASLYNLNQIHMLSSIADIIIGMIGKELLFIADLPFVPFFLRWLKKKDYQNTSLCWSKGLSFFLVIGLMFNMLSFYYSIQMYHFDINPFFERKQCLRLMGIITYQFLDAYNYLSTRTEKKHVTQADIKLLKDWFEKSRGEATHNTLTGIGHKCNLIVIQVESLQNFIIGMKWKGNEVSPNLNRLAETGIYFNQLFDQTWAGNTSDASFLANCSLYPSRRGAVSFLYAQNHYYCLPKILEENGYRTVTMHAYRSSFWNRAIFEKALGFKLQFYEDKYLMEDHLGWGLSDKRFFAQSVEKIRMLPSPFHVFLTTLSTHIPFDDVTTEIDNFPLETIEGTMIGHYMRSMHYVDSAIGDFLQKLSEYNLLSNSVIVIYGDHRARFEENDLKMIGITDMNELRKIPLIINIPRKKLGHKIDTIGGLIDFASTISNILGIDTSDKFFMGRDLLCRGNSFVIFRDSSYTDKGNFLNETSVRKHLMISDLILEKDLMPILRNKNFKP